MPIFLFLAGLAVYAGYGIPGLSYLLAVTAGSFLAGLLIPKYKFVLWISVGINVLALLLVKLQGVTGMAFAAPLGISYFTLRILSYNIDISRGKYPPERNFLRYGLYVSYLPALFLGPIERYDRFRFAALEEWRITWDGISGGTARVLWGLFKKLAIAARAGVIVGTISASPDQFRGAYALLAMVLYSIQLYADFSGGMDVVLGVSRILGIRLSENFCAPYFSQTVAEFWRRWHITLGSWLRDYVYIPLGGNRKGKTRKGLNTVLTFLVSGLWHGVSYLAWGLLNGILAACGDRLKTRYKLLNQIVTFLLVSFLWAFFVWPETMTALRMIGSVFTTFNFGALFGQFLELGLNVGEWIVLAVSAGLLWGYDLLRERLNPMFYRLCPAGRVAVMGALGLTILIFGLYGIGFHAEDFIYSRF
ncbi:MAG: MBOAT family O-acyltransferase [Oscillospiraceae bacterium]